MSQRAADESLSSSQKSLSSMIEARVFSEFMANDQVEVHRKAHVVLNRNLGAGAWLTSVPATLIPTSLPPSSPPVYGTGFAWKSGTKTLFVLSAGKHRTVGAITLSLVFCGGDRVGRPNAVRDIVHISPEATASSLRSKKSPVSCRLVRLTMVTLLSRPFWPRPLPTSGCLTAPRVKPRLGTSPAAAPSAPPFGPKPTGTRARYSDASNLANPSSTTPRPVAQAWVSSSVPSSLRR